MKKRELALQQRQIDALVARFRILKGWKVRLTQDPHNFSCSAGGRMSNHYHIFTWEPGSSQPDDYFFHEVLHAVLRALTRMDKRKPRELKQAEEGLVQDLCKFVMEEGFLFDLRRLIMPDGKA